MFDPKTGQRRDPPTHLCSFGITEGLAITLADVAVTAGVGAETAAIAGEIASPILLGAGAGALGSEVTGGDPGMGALTGAIGGGFGAAGGFLAPEIGLSSGVGTALGTAAGGAAGAAVTGGNPLLSAGEGFLFSEGGQTLSGGGVFGSGPGSGVTAPDSLPSSDFMSPDAAAKIEQIPQVQTTESALGQLSIPGQVGQELAVDIATGGIPRSDIMTDVQAVSGAGLKAEQAGLTTSDPTGSGMPVGGGALLSPTDPSVVQAEQTALTQQLDAPGGIGQGFTFNQTAGPGTISDPSGGTDTGMTSPPPITDMAAGVPTGGGVSAAGGAPPLGAQVPPLDLTSVGGSATPPSATSAGAIGPSNTTIGSGFSFDQTAGPGTINNPSGGTDTGTTSPGAASGGNSITNLINDPSLGTLGKAIGANAGPIIAGGGLLANLAMTPSTGNVDPNSIKGAAQGLQAQGQQLAGFLQSGTLPPGVQGQLDQVSKAMKARIISGYASRGQSADPATNSVLAQELNNVDLMVQSQGVQIAEQLLSTGINETNLAAGIYTNLLNINQRSNQATGQAIANFAGALAGGGQRLNINVGGGTPQTNT